VWVWIVRPYCQKKLSIPIVINVDRPWPTYVHNNYCSLLKAELCGGFLLLQKYLLFDKNVQKRIPQIFQGYLRYFFFWKKYFYDFLRIIWGIIFFDENISQIFQENLCYLFSEKNISQIFQEDLKYIFLTKWKISQNLRYLHKKYLRFL